MSVPSSVVADNAVLVQEDVVPVISGTFLSNITTEICRASQMKIRR